MKLAIMQPYFFPYLGYFALIKHTDFFIVFDTPQFIRHGWIERNRILKQDEGWIYINANLQKHSRETTILDIRINNDIKWKEKILAQLVHYKFKANYYKDVIELLNEIFSYVTDSIVDFDVFALKMVCEYLNINFNYSIFSEMNLKIDSPQEPDEWALNISKALDFKEYINPPNGEIFFNREKYKISGIELKFLKINLKEYNQKRISFENGLSIIDVMMFNSKEEINSMLNNFELF